MSHISSLYTTQTAIVSGLSPPPLLTALFFFTGKEEGNLFEGI
jgi:hypothetical protein